MSADDWEVCPRCRDRAAAADRARREAAEAVYGKVSAEEYLRLLAEAETTTALIMTFREDYEFYGVADGVITASYSGGCGVCGLSVSFRHEHPFYSPETADAEGGR